MGLMLLLLIVVLASIARNATKSHESPFNLGQAFVDADGKTSMARLSVFIALVISSWAFVVLVVTESLSETFFAAYIGAFVLNGIGSKLADKGKQDANTNT
jgi:hypothetical protein